MKRRFIYLALSLFFLAEILSACMNDTPPTTTVPSETPEMLPDPTTALIPSSLETQTWQDVYAELLRNSSSKEFFLGDIDDDGIPELLVGGPPNDADKYANYDVYTCKSSIIEYLGAADTLSWSFFWLDNNGGILGYSYGAGGGSTYRYYIDDGVLCYDDEVYGYYFDSEGNDIRWFRGTDGDKIIVTEETEYEYQCIWKSRVKLERWSITEDNITTVIYGGI